MCFTIPQKIIKTRRKKAVTKEGKVLDASLVPVKIGDWILAQNGLIISKMSPKQVKVFFQKFSPPLKQF